MKVGSLQIESVLRHDHERLDALLTTSTRRDDREAYESFRAGLLRHIGIEEKILIPFLRRRRPDSPTSVVRQLRLDHAALASLLVPTPTAAILQRLRTVLEAHNPLEEGEGGFYDICARLAANDEAELLARIQNAPAVPLASHYDGPRAFANIDRLLRAAGRPPV